MPSILIAGDHQLFYSQLALAFTYWCLSYFSGSCVLQFCKWTCKYVAYAANSTWRSASNKLLLLNFYSFFDSFPNLIIAFTKEWTCCGWHSSKTVKAAVGRADCRSLTNLRQGSWAHEYCSPKSDHLMSLFVPPHHSSLFFTEARCIFLYILHSGPWRCFVFHTTNVPVRFSYSNHKELK